MGLQVARLLVQEGAEVTLVGRNPQKLEDIRTSFETLGKVRIFHCDLT